MTSQAIIEAMKARPELWCSSNVHYRDTVERNRIVRGIAKKLGMTVQLTKKKWKNIKDHYRKEVRKQMAVIADNGVWECHWPHMERMEFLREEMFPVVPPETIKSESCNGHGSTEYDDTQNEIDNLLVGIEPRNQDAESVTSQKRPGSDLQEPAKRLAAAETSFGVLRETEWIDEDYHYCMSLLPTLRSLRKIQKLEFRGKVNQWLLETLKKNASEQITPNRQLNT